MTLAKPRNSVKMTNPDTVISDAGTLNPTTTHIMARHAIPFPQLSESDKRRFFAKISKTKTEAGCLEWRAGYIDGYGSFWLTGRNFRANRVAYFLANNKDPGELKVCHHCDNRKCCNPEHLYMGTHEENMRDMVGRGRSSVGIINNGAKLTDDQVIAIRSDTRFLREIAADYGVTGSMISYIRRRKNWKHLQ